VLPPAKIYAHAPAKRPWFGYPYAIVGAAPAFNAQAPVHGVGGGDEFLTGPGGAANVVNHPGGLSLRVSDDAAMAIEDSNLTLRQPKAFYVTAAVVAASNVRLTATNSQVRLVQGAQTITIWTGWWSQNVLAQTTPTYNGGNPDLLPQNCNAMGAAVMGWNAEWAKTRGEQRAREIAARLAPTARAAFRRAYAAPGDFDETAHINAVAAEYVGHATPRGTAAFGANQAARPDVGEAFMINTIGSGPQQPGGAVRVHDHASNTDRDLSWNFHFGGVVAKSGGDYVTLENYARGDNRQGAADPRWYFQMYGEAGGQTFHDFHERRAEYANPVTIAVNPLTRSTPIHQL